MKFRDTVLQHNPQLVNIPAGFKRYGHIMVLRSENELSTELGETVLKLYPWCRSVYQHRTTQGESRLPQLHILAGDDDPVVVHKENNVLYSVDISRITFSGGNRHLRERLVAEVQPHEFLLDMFAAVGNLSLQPLVHHQMSALLVERNPYTYEHLLKSLSLNNISTKMAINTDCRSLTLENKADRIFMGYHGVDASHLSVAVRAAKSMGYIHLHPLVHHNHPSREGRMYEQIFESMKVEFKQLTDTVIKHYAPGVEHHELIYQISK